MFRYDYGTHMYTRCCVPIDADNTRIIYYHSIHKKGALRQLLHTIYFRCIYTWLMHSNFSQQDYSVMAPQRYDKPEYLSSTDTQIVAWRRLLLKARGMPNATAARQSAAAYEEMPVAGE